MLLNKIKIALYRIIAHCFNMSSAKAIFNHWWLRAGKVGTMWDLQKLNKIYQRLIESSDDFSSVSFYMTQMFGFCCYMFCEISTLLDGHIRSNVQRNGFFREFVDGSKKGTYSVIPNLFSNKDITLQKCCRDYLIERLSVGFNS